MPSSAEASTALFANAQTCPKNHVDPKGVKIVALQQRRYLCLFVLAVCGLVGTSCPVTGPEQVGVVTFERRCGHDGPLWVVLNGPIVVDHRVVSRGSDAPSPQCHQHLADQVPVLSRRVNASQRSRPVVEAHVRFTIKEGPGDVARGIEVCKLLGLVLRQELCVPIGDVHVEQGSSVCLMVAGKICHERSGLGGGHGGLGVLGPEMLEDDQRLSLAYVLDQHTS